MAALQTRTPAQLQRLLESRRLLQRRPQRSSRRSAERPPSSAAPPAGGRLPAVLPAAAPRDRLPAQPAGESLTVPSYLTVMPQTSHAGFASSLGFRSQTLSGPYSSICVPRTSFNGPGVCGMPYLPSRCRTPRCARRTSALCASARLLVSDAISIVDARDDRTSPHMPAGTAPLHSQRQQPPPLPQPRQPISWRLTMIRRRQLLQLRRSQQRLLCTRQCGSANSHVQGCSRVFGPLNYCVCSFNPPITRTAQ